jgi:hypothetical protein
MSNYTDHDVSEDPIITLPCGHFYATSTLDGYLGIAAVYERDANGSFVALRSLYSSDITENPKGCPQCRAPIHSVNRYGRILKFSELRALERKHMMSIDQTLHVLAANPKRSTISALEGLEVQIKQSPMKQVWEASAGAADIELPKPLQLYSTSRLLRCCLWLVRQRYRSLATNSTRVQ